MRPRSALRQWTQLGGFCRLPWLETASLKFSTKPQEVRICERATRAGVDRNEAGLRVLPNDVPPDVPPAGSRRLHRATGRGGAAIDAHRRQWTEARDAPRPAHPPA